MSKSEPKFVVRMVLKNYLGQITASTVMCTTRSMPLAELFKSTLEEQEIYKKDKLIEFMIVEM